MTNPESKDEMTLRPANRTDKCVNCGQEAREHFTLTGQDGVLYCDRNRLFNIGRFPR